MKYSKAKPSSTNVLLIFSISSLAFIICVFFQLFVGIKSWGDDIKSQMKMYVYMEDSLSSQQLIESYKMLAKKPFIQTLGVKKDVSFVSKDKIASDFLKSNHENYQDLLGEDNPFKNLFILSIAEEYKSGKSFEKIASELKNFPGVYEVTYPNTFLDSFLSKIKHVGWIILVFIIILSGFVYLQLSNYIRLNIHSNRVLIKTMQLLGSTNAFIRKPYLLNSLLLGLLGGGLGYLVSNGVFYYFIQNLPETGFLFFDVSNQLKLFLLAVLSSSLFSVISTYFSLNRYLKIQHTNLF
ncbi:FtsX-like permease family protein [Aquirufa nivalisilvae]|uniref:Cell division protein FtsX n=1 Tax=Aquirufa nivalisilvae TaxID=2516557 RepID=A0A2S2DV73_9BACT|nr:permease-like cell division protein FtsX [Aquirufa nivalisilvae]AWL09275.1 Cell division protein FtsX [Aquirufa nivalisilvae]MCZ2480228.1 FtsX-like permease family protein [Aquirufa nivalisilvae]MCZ2482377.1 FtsX-like permease family protein [Aquirufa nivalisilvae]